MHKCGQAQAYTYTCAHTYTFTAYTHIHIHVHVHVHIHTDGYCNAMATPGTYIEGDREIQAACNALRINVRVYGMQPNDDRTFLMDVNRGHALQLVEVVHYNTNDEAAHYQAVERN